MSFFEVWLFRKKKKKHVREDIFLSCSL